MLNVMNRRRFGSLLVSAGVISVFPTTSSALAMEAGQVAHRINKADRLSMLAERVAKAIALIRLGVDAKTDLAQLQTAHDEFDDILVGFASGAGSSGITRERIVGVRNTIKKVEELWGPMRIAVEEIVATGTVDDDHFERIVTHDEALEHASHEVVRNLEAAYGGTDLDLGLALAIDLAGRQRMLTQKMSKELAFAAVGYHSEEAHDDFEKNCVKFGKIINVLITGGGGMITIAKPPTQLAAEALDRVQAHWTKMEPLAKELHSLTTPSAEQVAEFAHQAEELLMECDTVTNHYENYVAGIV